MKKIETAYFGGGCFWCTEAVFKNLWGVISVSPGYAGGKMKNPSYLDVSSGKTGHAETIEIKFDAGIISYSDLLDIFWHTHDPTSLDKQGNDTGSQYRSVIFFSSLDQKRMAENSLKNLANSNEFKKTIVTEIKPLDRFYPAEAYHFDYYNRHQEEPYCQLVISPKLKHLKEKFSSKLKTDF